MPRFLILCCCFALSGVAALVYQTAWTRQFALVFGTSELAVATVLAAYMGGLALGARLIEALLPRIRRPVQWYALLELGIGAAALALVPAGLWLAEQLLVSWFGGQAEPPASGRAGNTLFYLVAAFAVLLVPTTLMGATLPLLTRDGVHSEAQIGARIGTLYACNTAGAVAGALLAALWLLPAVGLSSTVWCAAGLNLLVCVLALLLLNARSEASVVAPTMSGPATSGASRPGRWAAFTLPGSGWVLPLLLLSGAVSFLHEVLWTRLLQRVVGGSIHAFGIMVASFLIGIALGGAVGARLANSRAHAARWLVASQLGIAAGAALAWYAVLQWAPALDAEWQRNGFSLVVLLPLTFAIGLTYPLAVRVLAADVNSAPAAAARVYSWNTAGAIMGALVGGFILIPALRYEGVIRLAVLASLLLALGAGLLLQPVRKSWAAALLALPVLALLLFHPGAPEALLRVSPLRSAVGDMLYYGVGRSADVVVMREDTLLGLRTNGLPEAASSIKGALLTSGVEAWMPAVSVIARPDTARMLVVGYGGGNVLQAVPPSVRSIDVIELEPEVIAANRALVKLRSLDPLRDSRVNIILNDARGALNLSSAHYDVIVSQPSHPWTAGASHLYTREFIQQAHDHLNPGGVYVQWMSTEFLDESLLRSMFATLAAVFPATRVYRTAPTTLMMMGSDQPIEPERDPGVVRRVIDGASLHYARIGLHAPEDLVGALALDGAGVRELAAGQRLITDDDNRLAMAAQLSRGTGLKARDIDALFAPYDPLTHADSFIHRELAGQLDFGYIWRRQALSAGPDNKQGLERLMRLADALGTSPRAVQLRYMMAMRLKQSTIAAQLLAEGLAHWPDSAALRYLSLESELSELAHGGGSDAGRANLAKLSPEAKLVYSGVVAATNQQWDQLRALDADLSQVSWTAPWGLQAAQLRCEWRVRVKNPELRQQVGDEGIAIADRALNTEPDIFWFSLRAWSAVGTGRPEVELESIAGFAQTLIGIAKGMTPEERVLAREKAQALQPLLEQLAREPTLDAARLQVVQGKMTRALALLG